MAPKTIRVLSLFSGCGGMDLGLEGGFLIHKGCINEQTNPDFIEKQERGNLVKLRSTRFQLVFANDILKETDMDMEDRITVVSAIGHHDESTGGATDPVSAALIIADKTDVRRSRVREKNEATFDKHDRVNYAVIDAKLKVDTEKHVIALNLQIDTKICTMYEYFEIFLGRMMMCRGAADVLGMTFKLTANGSKVL